MFRYYTFFLLIFLFQVPLKATHIVGGEVTYTCLGNGIYIITLTVYRDCYNGVPDFDDPAHIGIFDKNFNLVDTLELSPSPDDTLPVTLSNPCLQIPPNVCVHRTTYQDTVLLPQIPGGYTIIYQRCCRNTLIRNLPDPLSTGASFTVSILDTALSVCNNSAVFNNWPPVAICVNQPIDFDHSASDPDGDSLVYRLCTPLNGATFSDPQPYPDDFPILPPPPVVWQDPPYNLSNLLGGIPMAIDPDNGFITGVPNTIGNFVVGVCVDEYRNGLVISTTRRDFQYNVADCGEPAAAFFTPQILCDTLRVRFDNNSISANSFRWYFDYPDTTFRSVLVNPTVTFPDTGRYTVMLIARKNNVCSDTTFAELYLTESLAIAGVNYDVLGCENDTLRLQALDLSIDTVNGITGWSWQLFGPGQPYPVKMEQNPVYDVTKPGSYRLVLTVSTGNGCTETASVDFSVPIPPEGNFSEIYQLCLGDSVVLTPFANPDYLYQWSPSDYLSDSTSASPVAFPIESTTYQVTVTVPGGCSDVGIVQVELINSSVSIDVTASDSIIFLGDTVLLTAVAPGATQIAWIPADSVFLPNAFQTGSSPETTTTYTAIANYSADCELRGSVRVVVITPECDQPYVFFPTAFSPNGDSENEYLKLESVIASRVYWVIYNRWGQKIFEANSIDDVWDGTFRGEPQPAETYGYYLEVECVNGANILQKKGNITLLR